LIANEVSDVVSTPGISLKASKKSSDV